MAQGPTTTEDTFNQTTSDTAPNGHGTHNPDHEPASHVRVQIIHPSRGWLTLRLREVWEYRSLLYFFAWRDVKVRYKQTALGASWAILQPFLTMVIFTMVFGKFAKVPSDDLPYPIFSFTALLPWGYFQRAITTGSTSLVTNSNLVRKVYFPRLIVPMASVSSPVIDLGFSFIVLIGMMIYYGIAPTWGILLLPVFVALSMLTALSVSLWLTSLNVRYRDVGVMIPFLTQIWLYATPVAYPLSVVPEQYRLLFALNPMTGVVEGFRWALLGKAAPDVGMMILSTLGLLTVLIGGLIYFKRTERTFADVI